MALKLMSYNCKGVNVIKYHLLNIYCLNAMYCCCRKLGCTPVNFMYLRNIFPNGHLLMYVELMNLYYSMVAHMGGALYFIVRFLRSQRKFGLNLNASVQ